MRLFSALNSVTVTADQDLSVTKACMENPRHGGIIELDRINIFYLQQCNRGFI
jgi:hypothetical protein